MTKRILSAWCIWFVLYWAIEILLVIIFKRFNSAEIVLSIINIIPTFLISFLCSRHFLDNTKEAIICLVLSFISFMILDWFLGVRAYAIGIIAVGWYAGKLTSKDKAIIKKETPANSSNTARSELINSLDNYASTFNPMFTAHVFSSVKENVKKLNENELQKAINDTGKTYDEIALMFLSNEAWERILNKEGIVRYGMYMPIGDELLRLYKWTLTVAKDNGYMSADDYKTTLNTLDETIRIF